MVVVSLVGIAVVAAAGAVVGSTCPIVVFTCGGGLNVVVDA